MMEKNNVKDKVIVVTAGCSNLGRFLTNELAQSGAKLALLDDTGRLGEAYESELNLFTEVLFLKVDVADLQAMNQAVTQILERFHHIDVLLELPYPSRDYDHTSLHELLTGQDEYLNIYRIPMSIAGQHCFNQGEGCIICVSRDYGVVAYIEGLAKDAERWISPYLRIYGLNASELSPEQLRQTIKEIIYKS